ncbi:hypothetical protein NDU88_006428 [Pleurodeles waltl]|uniref:Uncharacterized protein n=1 Tax=Pleurodeles waltl TaxID=8319 RepID=A0AAV7N188_PLEWA|nr:hypothetical protein NDU88_006428 [Pleurodeles waltl]
MARDPIANRWQQGQEAVFRTRRRKGCDVSVHNVIHLPGSESEGEGKITEGHSCLHHQAPGPLMQLRIHGHTPNFLH